MNETEESGGKPPWKTLWKMCKTQKRQGSCRNGIAAGGVHKGRMGDCQRGKIMSRRWLRQTRGPEGVPSRECLGGQWVGGKGPAEFLLTETGVRLRRTNGGGGGKRSWRRAAGTRHAPAAKAAGACSAYSPWAVFHWRARGNTTPPTLLPRVMTARASRVRGCHSTPATEK